MTEQELKELVAKAQARFDALSPEEQAAHRAAQRDSYVRAELSWPKPVCWTWNGVTTYASYSDYLND